MEKRHALGSFHKLSRIFSENNALITWVLRRMNRIKRTKRIGKTNNPKKT